MTSIPFVQFLRPNGERRSVWIKRPQAICDKAEAIIKAGFEFECEELVTGHASFTISDEDGDWGHTICSNGPRVPESVDRLVEQFDLVEQAAERQRRGQR